MQLAQRQRGALISGHRAQTRATQAVIHAVMILVAAAMLLPFVLVLAASLTPNRELLLQGYKLLPDHLSVDSYSFMLRSPASLLRAYGVTLFVTLAGTTLGMLVMSMTGYALSRILGRTRRALTLFVLVPILFSGGLIPFYLVMTQMYRLNNSLLALIIPYLVSPFYLLLLRSYFNQLPHEIIESAKIDGAGEARIFFQIAVPLSTPALATIGLFTLLGYWNDYWLALLFIRDSKLIPLQYLLFQMMNSVRVFELSPAVATISPPTEALRMAMAVVAAGPAIFVSLLLGRYFVRGITLGALK
jgi:putative aldouronate transport system permease protein